MASDKIATAPRTWRQWSLRTAWRVTRFAILLYVSILLLFMFIENSLVYFPAKYPAGDWEPRGLKIEEAEFTSADGTQLHGWYAAAEDPEAVVLFCHGNAGNVTHRDDTLAALPRMQASVLVFDYRGYGKSAGSPTEAGVLADARAARKWLAEKSGVAESDIVVMGESLGGAVAVDLAAKDGARALILEDTFTSLPDVAAYHYPWLPVRLAMRNKLNALAIIKQYHGPLLMSHGDADTIVPYRFGWQLFEAANEPKQFYTQTAADHNHPRNIEYYEFLARFLRELPPLAKVPSP
jgi:fermentation-respiration switch protein FrsA (DUF1100 family)